VDRVRSRWDHHLHRHSRPEGYTLTRIVLVTGAAGYGKTHWLLEQVASHVEEFGDHGRLLALSRMHGARRRLDAALAERYPHLLRTTTTIDSFALSLVNRWRRFLGSTRPFVIGDDPEESLFGTQSSFEEILCKAIALMQSQTVRSFVGSTYPVIAIDEFQDCLTQALHFVQSMAGCSTLLLAGDEFQLLDAAASGCPAVEWVRDLKSQGGAEIVELAACRRTTVQPILKATAALRQDVVLTGESIPIFLCPGPGPAAYRIIDTLVYARPGNRWTGTCALLTPSHDAWLGEVLSSCDRQLAKRHLSAIGWTREMGERADAEQLLAALQVDDAATHKDAWPTPPPSDTPLVRHTVECVRRFAHARGLTSISRGGVAYLAKRLLHAQRTRGHYSPSRVVCTIHGAKNREFDHVFILWPYKVPSDRDMKLRLLYNAISRARRSVMLLVHDDGKRFAQDSVLRLLGEAKPAFAPKKKLTASSWPAARTRRSS
jgi:hypothetical protein